MADLVLDDVPGITLSLRRSARAKRISLRISQLDGRVTLTLPNGVHEREAMAFVRQKEDWIRKHLDARPATSIVSLGGQVPYQGRLRQIVQGAGRSVVVRDDLIHVPGSVAQTNARLLGFYKQTARDKLAEASDHFSAKLGRPYQRLSIRDTRSRWGSCSSGGTLMYSWRLLMAPPEVLRYVAAHEVAHLQEMNHSAAFWNVVTDLYGDYRAPRTWLRTQGTGLHQYRFKD